MLNNKYRGRPTCAAILEKSESWLIDKFEIKNEISNSFLSTYLSFKQKQYKSHFNENFVKVQDLGSGAFGCVIKAKNKTNQQIYAIKIIEMAING